MRFASIQIFPSFLGLDLVQCSGSDCPFLTLYYLTLECSIYRGTRLLGRAQLS
jgi:hypothetical protein